MAEAQEPTIIHIRLPVKVPERSLAGLVLGSVMILSTCWIWLSDPVRFADPCVPALLIVAGIAALATGASWFAVDHAILLDLTKQKVHYDARKKHSSWLNAQSIEVQREPTSRSSKRPVWRVYLVKVDGHQVMLWEGRRQRAASRIARTLSEHILKPWFLIDPTAGQEQSPCN